MSLQIIQLLYLVAAVCFILSLKFLSSQKQARLGSTIGILGMAIAIVVTFFLPDFTHKLPIIATILLGAVIGGIIALKISMTAMPQLVAGFHSFVGLAAVFVAYATVLAPENFSIGIAGSLPINALIEISVGVSIGALTFSGSIIAFLKLQGLMKSSPLKFYGQQYICLLTAIILVILVISFIRSENIFLFNLIVFLSLLIGVLLIIPVGGADMPVIVSMLNSYSGFAAAGIGFTLSNSLLIITGALVGSSGAILSYIMCKAMNRSLIKVIFGAFLPAPTGINKDIDDDKIAKTSCPEDAAHLLLNTSSVIIVPGYGMAVAQSQHIIKEMVDILERSDINVRFAVHPVAGRMPGHMNVLLAEANIDYEKVLELEEINRDFATTDVVLVIGANDVTNPAAKNDPNSPIYGMPVLDVEKARTILFIKRSMASGYAGIKNALFYRDNTFMLFGDAKKVVEEIVKFLNED
ncbi:NAD synthetase [Rickettsia rhipicephali]|uniref:NAD(P) transhydrogenase subunit beta n=1 Tax=Rickettsia rhipicephali (strain 3-7-female6-CWPP) TaxID=1105113 RepID=A0AAI8A901_RICR3|nr:NAD(P)(+) transhydrogenase (Re/Si-specific) subunit beta [Rickettsia rhipicephali]AFC71887.1 NAD(p) transhydrogenase subunit beta [Rickettsia rhipicephali str. 3-7-female6-CWPP]ALN41747.1 NAD synthetase [Rickettsia rhipicephali]